MYFLGTFSVKKQASYYDTAFGVTPLKQTTIKGVHYTTLCVDRTVTINSILPDSVRYITRLLIDTSNNKNIFLELFWLVHMLHT